MQVSAHIVDFTGLTTLRRQPKPAHEITYIGDGSTVLKVTYPEERRVYSEFYLDRPLREV
jgi:hypothetical protein